MSGMFWNSISSDHVSVWQIFIQSGRIFSNNSLTDVFLTFRKSVDQVILNQIVRGDVKQSKSWEIPTFIT